MTAPSIELVYPCAANVHITFDPLDRERPWLKNLILLPWAIPRPVIGFVHPMDFYDDEDELDIEFLLQHSLEFHGQVGIQQTSQNSYQPVEGPKVLLPFSLIAPIHIQVRNPPGVVWVEYQSEQFKEVMSTLIMNFYCPPLVKPASLLEMPR